MEAIKVVEVEIVGVEEDAVDAVDEVVDAIMIIVEDALMEEAELEAHPVVAVENNRSTVKCVDSSLEEEIVNSVMAASKSLFLSVI